ncbi:hypothetical protein CY34DRAFT_800300 [Suillus luteus UH-Slu-Lm8-n1]|uniref:Uncharacterized protein n=1 Tax=Suillus luteus UH-Slu-Lm8-n1 TaxID=930992 RepID=A0A0D0BKW7_9AGAM|nr:hypothetical protein CY34DRAFT_800300 [Suillus luteus UH-Slu-Lm8-n1]
MISEFRAIAFFVNRPSISIYALNDKSVEVDKRTLEVVWCCWCVPLLFTDVLENFSLSKDSRNYRAQAAYN